MRPVNKGSAPRAYQKYQHAIDDLIDTLGFYCSYCEQVITHAPEVEHVQPKKLVPALEESWDNFLLGCKSCNTIKGKSPVVYNETAWPDQENTFRGLVFYSDGRVEASSSFSGRNAVLMANLIRLVKLHRHPSGGTKDDRPTPRDKRSELRLTTWTNAEIQLGHYREFQDRPDVLKVISDQIIDQIAPRYGFFSIWMTVFSDHPEIRRRLIHKFSGTAIDCFDGETQPVPRISGAF